MSIVQAWWRSFSERRRARHESPFGPDGLVPYRRKGWRLVRRNEP